MTDTPASDPVDQTPIDAEFEPAEVTTSKKSGNAPGWKVIAGLIGFSLICLGIAAMALGFVPGLKIGGDGAALKTDIAALQTELAATKAEGRDLATRYEATRTEVATLTRRLGEASRSRADLSAQVLRLENQLSELSTQSQTVTLDPETGAAIVAPVNPLILGRIEALEDAITQFPAGGETKAEDTTALRREIAALRAQVSALETAPAPAAEVSHNADAALALAAIEAAARRGQPFQSGYQRLAAALPDNSAVQTLAPLAAKAVATRADLIDRFDDLRAPALDAEAAAISGTAAWMRGVFGDGITIQKSGENSAAEVLNRATEHLENGDLSQAIVQVESLPENVQTVFTDWLDNARERTALENALEALRLTMIARDRP